MALIVLMPGLLLGTFGGAQFLMHSHGGHGSHLHVVHPINGDVHAGVHEAAKHCHAGTEGFLHTHPDPLHEHSECPLDPCQDDVVVSVPDHEVVPTRAIDLAKVVLPTFQFALTAFPMPASPDLKRHVGAPGGPDTDAPMHIRALTACDRLVRTSRALLI